MTEKFGATCELIAAGDGVFEVMVNDELVYSKKETGRHANPGEVARLIENR
ncbi:MAG: SelT/SelW/SelH family protein [bacterium]|nr:SelT/SelW/SelH family protein [bacterium]